MLRIRILTLALIGLTSLAHAQADEPKVSPMPAPEGSASSLYRFATEHPDCAEWTDACQICIRDDKGEPKCSTPGIACTPGALVCRAQKAK